MVLKLRELAETELEKRLKTHWLVTSSHTTCVPL